MKNLKLSNSMQKTGFTLLEWLVTLVMIAVATIISMALFTSYIKTMRRVDAANTLVSISLAQERYHSTHGTYGTLAQVWGKVSTTQEGYYTLAITNVSATSYTLMAIGTGSQKSDIESDGTECQTLTLSFDHGTLTKSPAICWPLKTSTMDEKKKE